MKQQKPKIIFVIINILITVIFSQFNLEALAKPISKSITTSTVSTNSEISENIVKINNLFALDLFRELKRLERGNLFFSPLSICSTMAMLYEGARGKTAEEIKSACHFENDKNFLKAGFSSLLQNYNQKKNFYELWLANAIWIQKDYQILNEFQTSIKENFYGKIALLNFKNSPESARKIINSWIEEKTKNKIKNFLPRGSLNPSTRLVLTNAIYFKGNWQKQFDKNLTQKEKFWINPKESVLVEMMRSSIEPLNFNYAELKEAQILELPYAGEELSMIFILPTNKTLEELENSLSLEKIKIFQESLKNQPVKVLIPKFTFKTKYSLNEPLKNLGMLSAFSEDADFSGISGKKELFISNALHQAFIEVTEKGTEAAGATGIILQLTAVLDKPKVPEFRADHPFLFFIQERKTGNILFMGKVVQPVVEE